VIEGFLQYETFQASALKPWNGLAFDRPLQSLKRFASEMDLDSLNLGGVKVWHGWGSLGLGRYV